MSGRCLEEISDGAFTELDSIWCTLSLEGQDNLVIGICYRSPNSTDEYNDVLNRQLVSVCSKHFSHLCIMVDFNYKEIKWNEYFEEGPEYSQAAKFFENSQDLYLFQHVNEPTRFREGHQPSLLDLVFSNEKQMIDEVQVLSPLGKSDHGILLWTFDIYSNIKRETHQGNSLNFRKADIQGITRYFEDINWKDLFRNCNIEEAWSLFREKYDKAVEIFVPERVNFQKKSPWMKSYVKKAIRKKRKLWSIYKQTGRYRHYESFLQQRNRIDAIIKDAQKNYEKMLVKSFKQEPKRLYSYIRSRVKDNTGVTQLEKDGGELTKDNEDIANILNQYFTSVFTNEPAGPLPDFLDRLPEGNFLSEVKIDWKAVKKEKGYLPQE